MAPEVAILTGAISATIGWLYTNRRNRALSRKQHTINVMIQAQFNADFRAARNLISPMVRENRCLDRLDVDEPEGFRDAIKFLLNHYEFISSGLRNGDFDEQIVKDCERGSVVKLWECCEQGIYGLRTTRARDTIYEHLQWLHKRWEKKPPGFWQRGWERIILRPVPGRKIDPHD